MLDVLSFQNFVDYSVNECIVAAANLENKKILFKHRDRNYKPTLEIVHTIHNGVEIAYLHDKETDWSEGINEYGIAVLNAALLVVADEKQGRGSAKKRKKKSLDGNRMRYILSFKNIEDVVNAVKTYAGGVNGHTIVGNKDKLFAIEQTSKMDAVVNEYSWDDDILVRTNHGIANPKNGYPPGSPGRKSSEERMKITVREIKKASHIEELLTNLRKRYYGHESGLNPFRATDNMKTSSQLCLDLENIELRLFYYPKHINSFEGVKKNSSIHFEPKIKISFEEIQLQ